MKQVLGYYLLLINAIGLLIMCIDKLLAKKTGPARAGADAALDRGAGRELREPSWHAACAPQDAQAQVLYHRPAPSCAASRRCGVVLPEMREQRRKSSQLCVGADDSVRPLEVTNSPQFFALRRCILPGGQGRPPLRRFGRFQKDSRGGSVYERTKTCRGAYPRQALFYVQEIAPLPVWFRQLTSSRRRST